MSQTTPAPRPASRLLVLAAALAPISIACNPPPSAAGASTSTTSAPPPVASSAVAAGTATASSAPEAAVVVPRLVRYVPLPASAFRPKAEIEGWIAHKPIDVAQIDAHKWSLWRAMTAPSGERFQGPELPVWETWYDASEVYRGSAPKALAGARSIHLLKRPRQLLTHGVRVAANAKADPAGDVLAFNRFTQEILDGVHKNDYDRVAVLNRLAEGLPPKPLSDRHIKLFADRSVMMKPVFELMSSTAVTVMPYWAGTGPGATTAKCGASNPPCNPSQGTWKQCVLVVPAGVTVDPKAPLSCNGTPTTAAKLKQVRLSDDPKASDFHAFKLTQADIDAYDALNNPLDGQGFKPSPGDYGVFLATHVSTREVDDWTWQTFWWSPPGEKAPAQPDGAETAPADIPSPWNRYASCQAYYMVDPANDPKGKPLGCYNPYLETNLQGLDNLAKTKTNLTGAPSNCMTCHRAAAWFAAKSQSDPQQLYIDVGQLSDGDPQWFTAQSVTSDFLWSMPSNAQSQLPSN